MQTKNALSFHAVDINIKQILIWVQSHNTLPATRYVWNQIKHFLSTNSNSKIQSGVNTLFISEDDAAEHNPLKEGTLWTHSKHYGFNTIHNMNLDINYSSFYPVILLNTQEINF